MAIATILKNEGEENISVIVGLNMRIDWAAEIYCISDSVQ